MSVDPKQIEALLAEKKFDEVRALISEVANEKMTDGEKGAAYVDMALVYMKLINNVNLEYRDALASAIASIKTINTAEANMDDKIKLASVRQGLGLK